MTHRKPHHPASKDTIPRWTKEMLKVAGMYRRVCLQATHLD